MCNHTTTLTRPPPVAGPTPPAPPHRAPRGSRAHPRSAAPRTFPRTRSSPRHSVASAHGPPCARYPTKSRSPAARSVPWPVRSLAVPAARARHRTPRSEEHTSELQSLMRISYAVFCLKKKKQDKHHTDHEHLPHTHHQDKKLKQHRIRQTSTKR